VERRATRFRPIHARLVDVVRQDISYAVRGLRRHPGFTAVVVLTLSLGLGVNAAVFSLVSRLFADAPALVREPARVRRLYLSEPRPGRPRSAIASTIHRSRTSARR
jgi:hypothetical protein